MALNSSSPPGHYVTPPPAVPLQLRLQSAGQDHPSVGQKEPLCSQDARWVARAAERAQQKGGQSGSQGPRGSADWAGHGNGALSVTACALCQHSAPANSSLGSCSHCKGEGLALGENCCRLEQHTAPHSRSGSSSSSSVKQHMAARADSNTQRRSQTRTARLGWGQGWLGAASCGCGLNAL